MSWVGRKVVLLDGRVGVVIDERDGEVLVAVAATTLWVGVSEVVPLSYVGDTSAGDELPLDEEEELYGDADEEEEQAEEDEEEGAEEEVLDEAEVEVELPEEDEEAAPEHVGAEPPEPPEPLRPVYPPRPPTVSGGGGAPRVEHDRSLLGVDPDRFARPQLSDRVVVVPPHLGVIVSDLDLPRLDEDVRGITLDPGGGTPPRTPTPATAGGGHRPPGPQAQPPRSLSARLPLRVPTGEEFVISVQIIQSARPAPMGGLATFTAAPGGTTVYLVADAPGLTEVEGRLRRDVTVFPTGDTEAVDFIFRGEQPGAHQIYVRALDGGTYLGEITLSTTLEHGGTTGPVVGRESAVSDDERTRGELSLLISYDHLQKSYRFQFIDADLPEEVLSDDLLEDPRTAVERLVRQLDTFASATSGYSAAQTRDYLMNAGVQLWSSLLPADLREQFWERRDRVSQLTIFADADVVPWELLFPLDRGRTPAGFLVEQFPVVRWRRGPRPVARAGLRDVRFVVPPGSPPQASGEVDAIVAALEVADARRVTTLDELSGLVSAGGFDALHFACHNAFSPDDGSAIHLDAPFSPVQLQVAQTQGSLESTHPLVFMNACRSTGQVPGWTALGGWAEAFLDAGAGAFIGSSWAVRDSSAREFAEHVYGALHGGRTLGEAVTEARVAIADAPGDSSWLAYTVYGNPRLRMATGTPS